MSILFSFFYFFIIVMIIINALRIVKSFRINNSTFDNVEDRIRQRYNSRMQNNISQENTDIKNIETAVDLDDFMKSNYNPIKETSGKRRKMQ